MGRDVPAPADAVRECRTGRVVEKTMAHKKIERKKELDRRRKRRLERQKLRRQEAIDNARA